MHDWTETDWLFLHELRLRGLIRSASQPEVEHLVSAGVVAVNGNATALTSEGRAVHAHWALVVVGSDAHAAATHLYAGFHELNRELLALCTAWQVSPIGVANDHHDASYDWDVIARLERFHERAIPRVRHVAKAIPRFGNHESRLRVALRKVVDDGDTEWFTSPRIDSYHTVWNQLHEDLLLALGLDRSLEP